jgi:hypothetical protein
MYPQESSNVYSNDNPANDCHLCFYAGDADFIYYGGECAGEAPQVKKHGTKEGGRISVVNNFIWLNDNSEGSHVSIFLISR